MKRQNVRAIYSQVGTQLTSQFCSSASSNSGCLMDDLLMEPVRDFRVLGNIFCTAMQWAKFSIMYLIIREYGDDRMHRYCGLKVDCSLGLHSIVFNVIVVTIIYVYGHRVAVNRVFLCVFCFARRRETVPLISVGLLRRTIIILHIIILLFTSTTRVQYHIVVVCTCAGRFARKVPRNRFANLSVPANCANAAVCRVPAAEAVVMNGSSQ